MEDKKRDPKQRKYVARKDSKKVGERKKEMKKKPIQGKQKETVFLFFEIFCDKEKAWDFGKWKKSPSFQDFLPPVFGWYAVNQKGRDEQLISYSFFPAILLHKKYFVLEVL